MPLLRLHTLGTVYVGAPSGERLGGPAAQRRTLALLALLAVAGDGGMSRDKLMGLLWPESTTERARHSLTQLLYSTRRALGAEDLFAPGPDIRLNPERITADVRELEGLLNAGELERAVAIYEGPFLDGFFVAASPDFEQWAAAQRERLEARTAAALDALASGAERDGDYRRAVEWRRRLAALRPFDAAATVNLMTALALAGDPAGALQQARLHETLLREQLDMAPDPVVTSLAARLREPVPWEPERTPIEDAPAEGAPLGVADAASPEEDAAVLLVRGDGGAAVSTLAAPALETAVGTWIPAPPPRRWRRPAVALLAALGLAAVGVLIARSRRGTELEALALRQRVVVAPFRVAGADPSLGYLRDGMVELLATRLADDTAARAVDAGAVLGAWRAAGLTAEMDEPRAEVVRLAGRLGAERVVVGSVVGEPRRVIVHATALKVPSGAVSAEASVTGPVDSLTTMIDRLAAQLLSYDAGEDEQFVTHTTAKLPALRAYLAGQAALREDDYGTAIRRYEDALRRDSTFALAALQMAVAADRLLDVEQLRRAVARAWIGRAGLGARDRALLLAYAGPRFPAPSTDQEQRAAWQQVVELAPQSADAWFALGTRLYRDGATAGIASAAARAADAFRRALAADGSVPATRGYLALLHGVPQPPPLDALGPFAPFVRWHLAVERGDTAALRRARDTLYLLGPANLRAIAMGSQYDAVGLADAELALSTLEDRPARAMERAHLLLGRHSLALNRGRWREAAALTTRLAAMQNGPHAGLRLRMLDGLYGDGDAATAADAARALAAETRDASGVVTTSETRLADACVQAQWQLARGDTARIGETLALLRGRTAPISPILLVATPPALCADLLETWTAVLLGTRDARARLQRLDSLALTPQVAGDASHFAPLLLARLHERVGDAPRALAALRRRPYMSGWPRYLATMLREEGRLAELTGDVTGARGAYTRYLRLRAAPAPELASQASAVRTSLSRLHAAERR